jgi:predicted small lipoprotein YifL
MQLRTTLGIMLVTGLLLQGCGRKGPLKLPLPDQKTEQMRPVPVITPAK